MRVPEFLKAKAILPTVALVDVPRGYLLDRWLPFRDVPTDDVMFGQSVDENPMADFVAVDAEVPKSQHPITQEVRTQVGFIRRKHEFKESDIRFSQELSPADEGGTSIIPALQSEERRLATEELVRLRQSIDARLEWLRVHALMGSVTYSGDTAAGDVSFTLNFNAPSDNIRTVTTSWDNASADIISDLNEAQDAVADSGGVVPRNLVIGRKRMLQMTKNTALKNIWRDSSGQGGNEGYTLGMGMVQQVLESFLGINVFVYEARTTTRAADSDSYDGAEQTITRNLLLPEAKALFLPDEPIGAVLTSPGPPAIASGAGLYVWDDTTTTVPYVHEVGVGFNAMPTIWDNNKLCVLTI